MGTINIKKELAPKGLEFHPADFVISDKWCTILTVVSYPKWITPGYLSGLSNDSGVKIVIKQIPLPFSVMAKMLNKQLAEIKSNYEHENDKTLQEQYRQDYDSLNDFIQMITSSQSRIFDFQMHVFISADSKEELDTKKVQVKNYLESMEMRAIPLRFEQKKVLKSILPIFPKQDIEDQIGTPITTPTIAAMYPFVFDSLKDPGMSCLLGTDFSGGVVLFNQFLYQIRKEYNRNNANLIILGTSGSGKSTAAKLILRSHVRNGYKIVVIDPEGELEEMASRMRGDFIDLGKGGQFGMINPLEVILEADDEEIKDGLGYTVLTKTLQFLKAFIKYYDPTITEDVLTMFSEIAQLTYQRFGISFETNFSNLSSEQYPTFSDLYETLKRRLEAYGDQVTHERDILEKLELKVRPLVKELKFYFDGHTTIHPQSKFIVFNIRDLMNADENIRNALFFNILKYAWSHCLDSSINTVLMVDEAHILLSGKNTIGADFLAQIQRRARKYNSGTIFITQQPSDFAAQEVITQGKAIFDNASYYLVMGLKKQAVEDLGLLIDLNEQEKESIKKYNQGEALFICGSRRMRIDVVVTEAELDSFGSRGGL
ncbi:MAG TPA: ATP-binding protein [Candidatus Aphodocola excrementigallinarum]|uniref:ATP-binding protein n=1 Tax=Candidatus Aphodocola excrementigallinarum TaxID=2840670 RepID=A0A9D1LHG6_9FIRM|nr:ATP-binding protein [Candidatus Aphodocola excrementigallinarum]